MNNEWKVHFLQNSLLVIQFIYSREYCVGRSFFWKLLLVILKEYVLGSCIFRVLQSYSSNEISVLETRKKSEGLRAAAYERYPTFTILFLIVHIALNKYGD